MPTIRDTRPWTRKPPTAVGLNRGHPLVQGLVQCLPFSDGVPNTAQDVHLTTRTATDWVTGSRLAMNDYMQWYSTPYGTGVANILNNVTYGGISGNVSIPNAACTFAALFQPGVVNDYRYAIATTSGNLYILRTTNTGFAELVWGYSASNYMIATASTAAQTLGTWHMLVGTGTKTAAKVYQDGILLATATGAGLAAENVTNLYYGGYTVGASQNFGYQNQTALTCVWNRVLTDGEVASFSANPWQIFQSAQGTWRFPSPAAAPTFQAWLYGDQIQEMYG